VGAGAKAAADTMSDARMSFMFRVTQLGYMWVLRLKRLLEISENGGKEKGRRRINSRIF
jgi:hypothetical protein